MKICFSLLIISMFVSGFYVPDKDILITWSKNYKLNWSDFKGTPNPESNGDAATAVRIEAKPYYKGRKLFYDIRAIFIPEKSWYKHQSDELLAHEQLHFDLAELYARQARKKVEELQVAKERDIKIFNKEIQLILNASNEADLQYDLETLHGSLTKAQERWKFKIDLELQILSEYAIADD